MNASLKAGHRELLARIGVTSAAIVHQAAAVEAADDGIELF